MSWLISLVLAGVIFTNDTNLPVQKNYTYKNNETQKIVRLDETERFEQTYPLSANGRVSVSNVNGSITIETWNRNEVKLEAVKTADSKERLSEVEIKIDSRADSFSVETNYDNWKQRNNGDRWKNGKLQVEFRLTVPQNAVLNEIETVNGSVRITNSNNFTKASTVNGQVMATNLRGTANLSTVNGTVQADFDQIPTGSKINLETVNGTVNLTIPSDVNATVKADTLNGSIVNDFGLPVRKGQYVGKDLYGKIGTGDVQIKLNSVNGGLFIKRKNDGKTPNPATNLLPPKGKDDDDQDWDDDDDDNSVNVRKINKEVDKTAKEAEKARKEAEKSVKQSQKEIKIQVNPQIQTVIQESIQASAEAIEQTAIIVNTEKVKEKIKETQLKQKENMARIANIDFSFGSPFIEKKNESFTVKGIPLVTVDAGNCAVSVRGWDKPEVQYSLTRISRNRKPQPLDFTVDHTDSEVNIRINDPEVPTPNRRTRTDLELIHLEVFVPKKSNLRIFTEREIRLENVSGDIELKGADETINVRDVDGKLQVSNEDGRIRVIGFRGELISETGDGEINLEGDFKKLMAKAGDGTIILTLPDNTNANILTNTKAVQVEGFSMVRLIGDEENPKYKIGTGGQNYQLSVGEGQIFVRNAGGLKARY